jgi:hypothetical protein
MSWTRSDPRWAKLSAPERAAAMALMEADRRNPLDARNAAGAMINRAAKSGQDLGEHVSRKIYQPTIEPAQQRRLNSILKSPEFGDLKGWVDRRMGGLEADPVNGATHFLAPPSTMLALERSNPSKYKNWGPRGANWTSFDPASGQYRATVLQDKSHHFLAPEGKHSVPFRGGDQAPKPQGGFQLADAQRSMPMPLAPSPTLAPQGREVVSMAGKTPEQQNAELQRVLSEGKGNINFSQMTNQSPQFTARPGPIEFSPRDKRYGEYAGPSVFKDTIASLQIPSDDMRPTEGRLPFSPGTPPQARGGLMASASPSVMPPPPPSISPQDQSRVGSFASPRLAPSPMLAEASPQNAPTSAPGASPWTNPFTDAPVPHPTPAPASAPPSEPRGAFAANAVPDPGSPALMGPAIQSAQAAPIEAPAAVASGMPMGLGGVGGLLSGLAKVFGGGGEGDKAAQQSAAASQKAAAEADASFERDRMAHLQRFASAPGLQKAAMKRQSQRQRMLGHDDDPENIGAFQII